MKIGFDAKRAVFNNTGLGNYSRLIVDALSEYYPENRYLLYTPKIKENERLTPLLARGNIDLCAPKHSGNKQLWRVSKGIIRDFEQDGIDLFHGLSNELPLSIAQSVPSVVTIHDLIFLHYPQYYAFVDRKIYDFKFRKACENSSRIIAVSDCTKCDIVDAYGISADKIDVVYQGCDEQFGRTCSAAEIADVRHRYHLPENDFILYVGTVEERKNVLLAVKALRKMDSSVCLVIVGRETRYTEVVRKYIAKYNLESRVLFRAISFADLPAAYSMARAFTYPSRYEGFGIPILESLSCKTPVVATTGSCLEEAGGDGTLYVNPDDDEGLAEKLTMVMTDEELRGELIEKGMAHAAKFSRKTIAEQTFDVYKRLLK